MSPLTRPSSPNSQEYSPHITQDHERPPTPSRTHSTSLLADHEMGQTKERSHLEIVLDTHHLTLKGTGVDVEPTRLSGHVMLYLSEDTPLKEITLQFRGKARIPIPASESVLASSASSLTYVVCNHEWSFLEGDKKHARTVKAGRHVFPFHLQIGGSLPSTIGTSVFGGASVCYKLRATAVRTGLSHNLQVITPIHIDRSFGHEALEYQQTLEIENTWPEKLMYSILLPHKAWAAGDKLTAILKFSPLAKGIHVNHIRTMIHETTKVYARSGAQDTTNVVASINHAIVDGKPTVVNSRSRFSFPGQVNATASSRNAVAGPSSVVIPGSEGSTSNSISLPMRAPSLARPSPIDTTADPESQDDEDNGDLTVTIVFPIPIIGITPTHSVEPIIVSHRVRWSILIRNMDGHTSELRCSLPIHVLDNRLLEEARSFSAATRRLVLGSSELPPEEEGDRELPSYAAHIRDRVANMFFPEAATVRVNNPWIGHIVSSQSGHDVQESYSSLPSSRARSGVSTPLEPHNLSHLPHAPDSDGIATLDLLHSELLLSLSDSPLRRDFFTPEARTPSDQASFDFSHPPSQNRSRPQSRHNSRPPSPDGSHHRHHDDTVMHHSNSHGRNLHSIFRATIKPFTSFGHHHSLFSRHTSHQSQDDLHRNPRSQVYPTDSARHNPQRSGTMTPSEMTGTGLLHRIFTEVPDYSIASRGFIGGVPPLESMRGLPSYEEVSRETAQRATSSDTDLTAGVASLSVSPSPNVTDGSRRGQTEERAHGLERRRSFPLSIPPNPSST